MSSHSDDKLRMLITSAGRRVELIQCFRDSAEAIGIPLKVFAADIEPELSSACCLSDLSFKVPRCTAPEYPEVLLKICKDRGVKLVIPTIDTELTALAEARERFAKEGIRINISSPESVAVCRDKLKTCATLAAIGIPVPKSAPMQAMNEWKNWNGPVIIKPVSGSSSFGVFRCTNARQAVEASRIVEGGAMAQELVEGAEYTVNCFFDQSGKLQSAVPHGRLAVRQGEVCKGITKRVPILDEIACKLEAFPHGFSGVICFQAIMSGDTAKVFEINARFGGGYPLAHRAGATFAQWLLEEVSGREPSYNNNWREGVTMLRYDQSVFLEPQ